MSQQSNARCRPESGSSDTAAHWSASLWVADPQGQSEGPDKAVSTFSLSHAELVVEETPAGHVVRIEHDRGWTGPNPEYAGPFGREMLDRLREVAE